MPASAVVPAYNEAATVGAVVTELYLSPLIDEVLVVSDGSNDDTATVAAAAGARVLEFAVNRGKAASILAGARWSRHDVLLLLDADLVGLHQEHIQQLVEPVLDGEVDMTVGLFSGGRPVTDWAQRIAPFLSGQRALKKEIILQIAGLESSNFGLEVQLNRYARENGLCTRAVMLPQLSHRIKEEKMGLWRGLQARLKMYWEIARSISFD